MTKKKPIEAFKKRIRPIHEDEPATLPDTSDEPDIHTACHQETGEELNTYKHV